MSPRVTGRPHDVVFAKETTLGWIDTEKSGRRSEKSEK
jgi:hypothetical protein